MAAASRRIAAALCGLAAAAWALAVPLLGARAAPGYSHVAQTISELGAQGAAHGALVSAAGFAPIGVLVAAFLVLAAGALPASARARAGLVCLGGVAAGYLGAALFRCDAGCPGEGSLSQQLHNLFGLLEYGGAIAGLALLGGALRAVPAGRPLATLSFVTAAGVAAGLLAMLVPGLAPVRGLAQRVAEAAIFGWIAIVSLRLLRGPLRPL